MIKRNGYLGAYGLRNLVSCTNLDSFHGHGSSHGAVTAAADAASGLPCLLACMSMQGFLELTDSEYSSFERDVFG
jgi:hypothetical protein